MQKVELSKDAISIIRTLEEAGHEAYAVGGCVRDALLGIVPKDIDITTSARPEEVKELFAKTFDTGIEHGTVTVLFKGAGYEVTTFRTDGKYSDHRRPDHVEYAATLEEDLSRRDFTINAMAFHPEKGIIDLFGGREDLEKGLIRCVGRAEERFDEDALRMLRAIRFAARLGYRICEEARQAIVKLAPTLGFVSRERVWDELKKTLVSPHPEYLEQLTELGLAPYVDPALAQTELLTVRELAMTQPDLYLRTALWLHRLGESAVRKILRDLKTDNETLFTVTLLVAHADDPVPMDDVSARRWLSAIGREGSLRLVCLQHASGRIGKDTFDEAYERISAQLTAPVTLKELAVTGRDLIEAGDQPGKELGEHLLWLLDKVIEEPQKNNRETLIALFKEHWYN